MIFSKMSPTDLMSQKVSKMTKITKIIDNFLKSPWDWIGVWDSPVHRVH